MKRQKKKQDLDDLDTLVEEGGGQWETKLSERVGVPLNILARGRTTHT